MNKVLRNISANFFGQAWVALIGVVFVPVYLRFIGVEGYGLVGFFMLLASAMAIFDGGLGAVATREASLYESSSADSRFSIASKLRSIETLFWFVAILFGVAVFFCSSIISSDWLKVESDNLRSISSSIRLMSVALVIQFPLSFYNGCFVGLQKQVQLNKITAIFATVRSAGAAAILWLVSPTIEAFFVWQCFVSAISFFVMRRALLGYVAEWSYVSLFSRKRFSGIWNFTAGVGITNVFAFLLIQSDKIILSKMFSLTNFGYYMLAWTVGSIAFRLISPVFNAYYPTIAVLVSEDKKSDCYDVFIRSCRILSSVVVPFSMWVALFSEDILFFWTGQKIVSDNAAVVLSVIALGTMFHSFMHMPYALQLANSWSKFSAWQNFVALIIILPVTYFLASSYGFSGGGWPWLVLNLGYVIICAPIILIALSVRPLKTWYLESIGWPVFLALIPLGLAKLIINIFELKSFAFVLVAMFFAYCLVAVRLYSLAADGGKANWKNIL